MGSYFRILPCYVSIKIYAIVAGVVLTGYTMTNLRSGPKDGGRTSVAFLTSFCISFYDVYTLTKGEDTYDPAKIGYAEMRYSLQFFVYKMWHYAEA